MTRRLIYHTWILALSFFWSGLVSTAHALEKTSITEVWPLGQKQQYLYYRNDVLLGESWMEIKAIPRTDDRFEVINTISLNVGADVGQDISLTGESRAEVDPWGHPISYDLTLARRGVTLVNMSVLFNWPDADFEITYPDSVRYASNPFNEESVLLDYHFIGLYDLAFRLEPVNPSAETIRRNYFVPQLEFNILSDYPVNGEEIITLKDGTEVPTAEIMLAAIGVSVWVAPDGKLVKAKSQYDGMEIWTGETVTP